MRPGPLCAALLLAALTACGDSSGEPARSQAGAPRAPVPPASPTPASTPVVQLGDGDLDVVPGSGAPVGTGPAASYVVEVEGGLGVDAAAFAADVERVLSDPRSWSAGGRRTLQRVDGGDVTFRVALASPRTTDRLCAPLHTGGYFSCANGDRAVLNAARWLTGAPTYEGQLARYRSYVVNHEVGHTLGFGHAECPGAGELAQVMVQQTKSLDGCDQNPWPYP
ncbi:MAG: hypothetical protein JWM64_387 [Frankiales bacterium]|nr:hypothetical protein [Frankiales bacterium]